MAGIILRAPDGSIMVTLTILSKTEGGPSFNDEDTAVDGAAAAAAMLRRATGAADCRAALMRQEESMLMLLCYDVDDCLRAVSVFVMMMSDEIGDERASRMWGKGGQSPSKRHFGDTPENKKQMYLHHIDNVAFAPTATSE